MLPISPDFVEGVKRTAFAGDDVIGCLAPDKGLRLCVVQQEVFVDGGFQIVDAGVTAAADAPCGNLGKEAFDHVQPRRAGRCEVQLEAWMFVQPCLDLGRLVGGVVVKDHVDVAWFEDSAVDAAKECQELLGPVPGHAVADDHARLHIKRGEQRGRAVALVVVGHGGGPAFLEWQP